MRKLELIILVLIFSGPSLVAQSWSSTLVENNLMTANGFGPPGGPYQTLSAYEIKPDATTINSSNSNSMYDVGTLFSAYSLVGELDLGLYPFGTFDYPGTWLFATDQSGNLLFSRKITLPQAFDFYPSNQQVGDHLVISSLSYNDDDLLVFTGSLKASDAAAFNLNYETMVVGTYNLTNDQVELTYFEHTPVTYWNGSNWVFEVLDSKGVGVQPLQSGADYMAVGQTEHPYTPLLIEHPLVMVFDVSSSGAISVVQKAGFEFKFKATEIDHFLNTYDVVATGHFKPDNPFNVSCPNYTTGNLGVGNFNIKYNSGGNTIDISSFSILYHEDYEQNRIWPDRLGHVSILQDDYEDSYVAFNEINSFHTPLNTIYGRYNFDLTNPQFRKLGITKVNNGTLRILDHDDEVTLNLVLDDPKEILGYANQNHIGSVPLDKSNFFPSGVGLDVLYSYDYSPVASNIRNFNRVTSANYETRGNSFIYYLADGLDQQTDGSRAHLYGVPNRDYGNLCFGDLEANISTPCFGEDEFDYTQYVYFNGLKYTPHDVASYSGAVVEEATGTIYNCEEFTTPQGTYKVAEEKATTQVVNQSGNRFELLSEKDIVQIEVYDLRGKLMETNTNLSSSSVDLNHLPSGMYILNFELVNGDFESEKVIVSK